MCSYKSSYVMSVRVKKRCRKSAEREKKTYSESEITPCNGISFSLLFSVCAVVFFYCTQSYLMTILNLNFANIFFFHHSLAFHLKSNIRKRASFFSTCALPNAKKLHGLFSIIYWMVLRICLLTWNKLMKILKRLYCIPSSIRDCILTLIRFSSIFTSSHWDLWSKKEN